MQNAKYYVRKIKNNGDFDFRVYKKVKNLDHAKKILEKKDSSYIVIKYGKKNGVKVQKTYNLQELNKNESWNRKKA